MQTDLIKGIFFKTMKICPLCQEGLCVILFLSLFLSFLTLKIESFKPVLSTSDPNISSMTLLPAHCRPQVLRDGELVFSLCPWVQPTWSCTVSPWINCTLGLYLLRVNRENRALNSYEHWTTKIGHFLFLGHWRGWTNPSPCCASLTTQLGLWTHKKPDVVGRSSASCIPMGRREIGIREWPRSLPGS